MIDSGIAQVGFHVYYQRLPSHDFEYGVIRSLHALPEYIDVLHLPDTTPRATRPLDLHWPPIYAACKGDPKGQPYSHGEGNKRAAEFAPELLRVSR